MGRHIDYDNDNGGVYVDNGCVASSTCLNCPLPQCRHDDPIAFLQFMRYKEIEKLLQFVAEGNTHQQTAIHFGITIRTVFRRLAQARKVKKENLNYGMAFRVQEPINAG